MFRVGVNKRLILPSFGEKLSARIDQISREEMKLLKKYRPNKSVYSIENVRIQKAIRSKFAAFIRPGNMRNDIVEKYLEINRLQKLAALKIQYFCRARLAKLHLKSLLESSIVIVEVQRVWRGFRTRKLLAKYLEKRAQMVILFQKTFRRRAGRKLFKRTWETRSRCAIIFQKWIRRYFAQLLRSCLHLERCATLIQFVVKRWLLKIRFEFRKESICATRIQKHIRGFLSIKKITLKKKEFLFSAVSIQRCFRGFSSRQRVKEIRKQCDFSRIRSFISSKNVEILLLRTEVYQLKSKRTKLKENVVLLSHEEIFKLRKEIMDCEREYARLKESRYCLTYGEIEQGWEYRIIKAIKEHREKITFLKNEFIFKHLLDSKVGEEQLQSVQEKIERLSSLLLKKEKAGAHVTEILNRLELEHRNSAERRKKAILTAHERRHWKCTDQKVKRENEELGSGCQRFISEIEGLIEERERINWAIAFENVGNLARKNFIV